MTKQLEAAIAKARALPEPEQDQVAALLLAALERDDRRWEELFSDPRSAEVLEKLWAEAEEEIARGEVYDIACAPNRT